jgi:hypothetical protein
MTMKPLRNNRGAVLVIVAISMVALLAVTGLAIDSGVGYGVKAKLNAALDAAAIAAARAVAGGDNDSERKANAEAAGLKYFQANFPVGWLGATPGTPAITAVHHPDGYWEIGAAGSATVPTSFMRILGRDLLTVNAASAAIRRDLDMVLVIDCSGSLALPYSPAGTFGQVKDAAKAFVDRFAAGPGGDRLGLVTFASGAELSVPIDKTSTRGFSKETFEGAIDALPVGGSTASAEAMRVALNELDAVPAGLRSSLRVVVFFSDGAPNDVNADFNASGGPIRGDLYSEVEAGSGPARIFRHDRRNSSLGTYSISQLPELGLDAIPLAGYNNQRTLTTSGSAYQNSRCNVNKAARNMVENVANTARDNDIHVYTLGLGSRLNDLEITFCSYGPEEFGANILRRLANANGRDGKPVADTLDEEQPSGLYTFAANADELEAAFNQIASDILRLTR